MAADAPYRLHELGWLQFERLCGEVLAREAGVAVASWEGALGGLRTTVAPGLTVPLGGPRLPGPTLVAAIAWGTSDPRVHASGAFEALRTELARSTAPPVSLMVLTDARISSRDLARAFVGTNLAVLGPAELGSILDANAELRRRLPFVLGVRDPGLIPDEVARRSTADVDACLRLARVFVPTRAYVRTLDVLDAHRFAVVTGPPEMGKTAIARTVALAAMADGWEAHECVRPDELWSVFERDRAQLFVADDAFGSTEYRPEAAERWALELDRVLRAMDDRHRRSGRRGRRR